MENRRFIYDYINNDDRIISMDALIGSSLKVFKRRRMSD